ncbi:MAG: LamG domain-containing protein [Sedimentisphaerales bacterium]|nr:LamG domain-containing protein [Sedimentisphaerales bacterium]
MSNPEVQSSFSVFAWVKGGTPGQVILAQTDGYSGYGSAWLSLDPVNGKIMTSLHEPQASPLISEVSISDGVWHEVGLVLSWPRRRLYVDGVKVAEDASDLTIRVPSTGGMYFGTSKDRKPDTFWSGMIDDIRVYDRAKAL